MTGAYCPWQHLGRLEGVSLVYADLEGTDGLTDFEGRTITLRRGMSDAERRSTLAHELVHLERGRPSGHGRNGREESHVARIEEHLVEGTAALRLVPPWILPRLEALCAEHGDAAVRDILGIDQGTLLAIDGLLAAVDQ